MARKFNAERLRSGGNLAAATDSDPGNPGARVRFERGSLLVDAEVAGGLDSLPAYLVWDARAGAYRCHALHYRRLIRGLIKTGLPHVDLARGYPDLVTDGTGLPEPYPHQAEALRAWSRAKRGVVELPTGAGKTQLALRAIQQVGRGALVLAPTLDLVAQWSAAAEQGLGVQAGLIGGGSFQVAPLTVCTYASAYRHAERFGGKFGLAVFDECHHLAAAGYQQIAEHLIAPYRLGLSATLARPDGREADLASLIGPLVYSRAIPELSGRYLSDYRVETVHANLSPPEREQYRIARETYLGFADALGLSLGSGGDWQRFVFAASRNAEGREALEAYYTQKRIAFAAEAKFAACADLLDRHRGERALIFSNDNATAYEVSRRFLLPIITHRTRLAERKLVLERFRENRWPVIVTSRVLNEGVDVPEAGVAIILSGTSSVREHVQRLGRILRPYPGKEAILYEVLTRGTAEESTSRRRRQHDAYR